MRIGDARAAGPRCPSDVWEFPRIVGNHPERSKFHPTQHPVVLYDRIMKFSCGQSVHGNKFLDMFAGSGTCFRAGYLNPKIDVTGIELDKEYCRELEKLYVRPA